MYICKKCYKLFSDKNTYNNHNQDTCEIMDERIINLINYKMSILEAKMKKYINKKTNVNKKTTVERIHLKPIIKWSGGKKDEIKMFIHHVPNDIDVYLEPFIGGGALYFYINPDKAIISDLHKELIDFYKAIKDGKTQDIYDFMKSQKNTEENYYKIRDNFSITNQLENAQRFYYLRKTCYRGMLRYNKQGKFNIPYGRYKTYNFDEIKNIAYEKLLQRTEIYNKSFEYIFETFNSNKNFMFLDPPYDSEFTDYGYCSFGKEHHKKLADLFKKTKIRCLMIIGKTDFICDLYKDFIVGEYDKRYRFRLHSKRVDEKINTKHLIIKNY